MNEKNFKLLWSGKLVSELGDKMYAIAMAWWILQESQSTIMMGIYLTCAILPGIVFGIVAGPFVDRLNLKGLMVSMDLIRGSLIVMMTALMLVNELNMVLVFVITMVISIASSFFNPTVMTIIPKIVKEDELGKANAFLQMIDGVGTIAGPILGVLIVSGLGYIGAFLINGVSYIVSAGFESQLRIKEKNKDSMTIYSLKSWIQDMEEGLLFLKSHKKTQLVIGFIAIAHFFVGGIFIMMPYLAKYISNDDMLFLSVMQVVFGSGFIIGSILLRKKRSGVEVIDELSIAFICIGVSLFGIGFLVLTSWIPIQLTVLCLFVIGCSVFKASVSWQVYLQRNTPEGTLGRISAIASLAGDVSIPLAYLVFGYLLDHYELQLLCFVSGTLLLIFITFVRQYWRWTNLSKYRQVNNT